ncbi:5'(3')-deoxyribonucleotidase, mitochondrial isoform 2-T2 [Ciconia maguari]
MDVYSPSLQELRWWRNAALSCCGQGICQSLNIPQRRRKPSCQSWRCEKAISIWESKNFFIELDPLPGAVEAVKQMANLADTDVFICTSPIKNYRYCPYEKYAWVEKHFGPEFLEQIILTRDKTVVSADLLIDDRPDITGAELNPSWEHVLFTACHNKHLQLKPPSRRLQSWTDDWNAILDSKRLPPGQAT